MLIARAVVLTVSTLGIRAMQRMIQNTMLLVTIFVAASVLQPILGQNKPALRNEEDRKQDDADCDVASHQKAAKGGHHLPRRGAPQIAAAIGAFLAELDSRPAPA